MREPMVVGIRRTGCLLLCLAVAGFAGDAGAELLAALDDARTEEAAAKLVEPHLGDLKKLSPAVLEKIVTRHWWALARDIVARSHTQSVDLSVPVRKAVRLMKDEGDELLRTLNPKYGQAQQVSPAFQWAQNDTSIFLTIKYTVRWNAPGALEVTEPSVNMSSSHFAFSGLGKHSNNKYRYFLSLNLFDNISSTASSWRAASVGKLSVTLRKRWARKWPRLLCNKKAKVSNMHVWMEMQDKMDSTLGGMATASHSPVTCAVDKKLYCLATDTCKSPENCNLCPNKKEPNVEEALCSGLPSEKATISFKDEDMTDNEIGGEVKVMKVSNEFDIDAYVLYFGTDKSGTVVKLEGSEGPLLPLGEAVPIGADTEIRIPMNTRVPEKATHLLIFTKNSYGEYLSPGVTRIKDAVLPKAKAAKVEFSDEDGGKGFVSGTVTITRALNDEESLIDDYCLHWGRSATRKIHTSSLIREISRGSGISPKTHYLSKDTKIPEGATHLLVFTKNEHGEHPSATSLKIVDHVAPCQEPGDKDCPGGVWASEDQDPDAGQVETTIQVKRAEAEANVESYALYWGLDGCEGSAFQSKNGHIRDLPVAAPVAELKLGADTVLPSGTLYILAFSKNKHGESDHCVAHRFIEKKPQTDEGDSEPLLSSEPKVDL